MSPLDLGRIVARTLAIYMDFVWLFHFDFGIVFLEVGGFLKEAL